MKQVIAAALIFLLCAANVVNAAVWEDAGAVETTAWKAASESTDTADTDLSLDLYARCAVLMDGGSGRVLYDQNGDVPLPMASTTKIMTCILALEAMGEMEDGASYTDSQTEAAPDAETDMDAVLGTDSETGTAQGAGSETDTAAVQSTDFETDTAADIICTVSGTASAQPEVKLGLVKDDTFYLSDLLYSLMLESHNDTAVCIAETIGGSVEGFAAMMNARAREIGCTQTYFITPNGLDAEDENGEHHTTAHDLALIMRYCLTESPQREAFLTVTQTSSYSFSNISGTRSYSCSNHNAFLNLMEGAISGKTGFTSKAGYCYVGALERDGKLLIVALLACGWPNNKGYKWVDTKKLMNYGLSEYELRDITAAVSQTGEIEVTDGQQEQVSTQAETPPSVEVLMRSDEEVEVRVEMLQTIEAPVMEGTQVGLVHFLVDGSEYAVTSILTTQEVKERTFLYCLRELTEAFLLRR
ncbi:MAG: D-alanyl-D-alanine carboxypeptidase [Clostridiales bacterium]|nr:D-alanyl-D-alanine carboxypeptidase [Clostridiales bacterium]